MDRSGVGLKREAWAALVLALLLTTSGEALGLALRGPSAEMLLDGLPLGQAKRESRPMDAIRLVNTGDEPIEVVMHLAVARPESLKDGYEPAPDVSWAKLDRSMLRIPPGKEGESALLIAIPRDRSLMGGRFQLEWVGEASAPSGARLELRSHVLMHVETEGSRLLETRRQAGGKGASGFSLSPLDARLEKVPLGRKVDLRELGLKLKLANPNEQQMTFGLSSFVDILDKTRQEEGFAPAANPNFLKPASPLVRVAADSVAEARFSLEIPDERRYRGRSWVFVVRVEPLDAGDSEAKDFRLYVTTKGEEAM